MELSLLRDKVKKNRVVFSNNLKSVMERISSWSEADRTDIYRAFARGIITEDFEQTKVGNRILVHKSKYKYGKTAKIDKGNVRSRR